jgi:hypothetical protein
MSDKKWVTRFPRIQAWSSWAYRSVYIPLWVFMVWTWFLPKHVKGDAWAHNMHVFSAFVICYIIFILAMLGKRFSKNREILQ